MKKAILSILILFVVSTATFAQDDTVYAEKLEQMLKLAGSEESYKVAIKQMITMFKQQYSNVEQDVWNEFEKDFAKASMKELTTMLVPVYQKHLTLEDLNGLIAFYQTPVGKKYAQKTPLIMQESMQVGQTWGMKLGQEFSEKMKEKGY